MGTSSQPSEVAQANGATTANKARCRRETRAMVVTITSRRTLEARAGLWANPRAKTLAAIAIRKSRPYGVWKSGESHPESWTVRRPARRSG